MKFGLEELALSAIGLFVGYYGTDHPRMLLVGLVSAFVYVSFALETKNES